MSGCKCGCGQQTGIVAKTQADRGVKAGEYRRFVSGHHQRLRRNTYEVDLDTGCWVWQGALQKGYGHASCGSRTDGTHRIVGAHVWIWEQKHGPVPKGLELDHLCRNRACVNPDHLEAVTHTENVRRGASQKLTDQQVRQIRATEGLQVDIAARFGVTQTCVSAIKRGTTHVSVA